MGLWDKLLFLGENTLGYFYLTREGLIWSIYLIYIFLNFLFHPIELIFFFHLIEEEGDQAMSSWSFLARGVALPWNTNTDLTFSNKHFGHRTSRPVENILFCKKAFYPVLILTDFIKSHFDLITVFRDFQNIFILLLKNSLSTAKFLTHKKR